MSRPRRGLTYEKIRGYVDHGAKITRAAFDIYMAFKRKDPVYAGMAFVSAADATLDVLSDYSDFFSILEKHNCQAQIFFNNSEFIKYILNISNATGTIVFESKRENQQLVMYEVENNRLFLLLENEQVETVFSGSAAEAYAVIHLLCRKTFDKHISLSLRPGKHGYLPVFEEIPIPNHPFISSIEEDKLVKRIKEFKNKNIQRSTIISGPPGVGKSTLAYRLAEAINGKLLTIDAGLCCDIISKNGTEGILSLKNILKLAPASVILLDDIDRVGDHTSLLGLMEQIHREYKELTILATVNDILKLPNALKRPGRFDEIIEILPPSSSERESLLKMFCEHFGVRLSNQNINSLVSVTEGLTGAFLKEIAQQASILPVKEVVERTKIQRKFFDSSEDMVRSLNNDDE